MFFAENKSGYGKFKKFDIYNVYIILHAVSGATWYHSVCSLDIPSFVEQNHSSSMQDETVGCVSNRCRSNRIWEDLPRQSRNRELCKTTPSQIPFPPRDNVTTDAP